MPPDYLQRLLAGWRPASGVVCAPPIGSRAQNFAAEIESAFLNTYQARWQYAADSVGLGFAQGKTMLWRRDILERGGGIEALGAEIAEDAASTKLVRRAALSANLVDAPFSQPLGVRLFRDVWARQLRWARLRRATFAPYFALELLTSSLFAIAAAAVAGEAYGLSPWAAAGLAGLIWYGAEGVLALVAGWSLRWESPIAWIARDFLLPWLWLAGWSGDRVDWRGNAMSVGDPPLGESSPR
jgi:ceramide glucosyltransferase